VHFTAVGALHGPSHLSAECSPSSLFFHSLLRPAGTAKQPQPPKLRLRRVVCPLPHVACRCDNPKYRTLFYSAFLHQHIEHRHFLLTRTLRWTTLASATLVQDGQEGLHNLNIRPSDLHELLRSCSCESALIQKELADVRQQMLALQNQGKSDMSDFAHGIKSGGGSMAALKGRHKRKLELSASEQALDLRLGAVLYVHNQTLMSLRREAGGIVKVAQGWSTSADAAHTSLLEKVLQREESMDGQDEGDGLKSLATK
jgi:hypothetical protein